jgi:hypothetical protein
VRHGRSEEGHDGVSDELLDRPAVMLELLAQEGVIWRERAPHVLHVHALAAAREPDEVGEEDGDHLALLAPRRRGHGGPAAAAEPEAVRVVLTAVGADRHSGRSVYGRAEGATARR